MLANQIKINPNLRKHTTTSQIDSAPLAVQTESAHSRLASDMPSPQMLAERIKQDKFDVVNKVNDYQVAAAYAELYTSVSSSKKGIIHEVSKMTKFYLVDTITTQLAEDALTPDISTNNIVDVSYEGSPEITKELEYLDEKIQFDQLCKDITPELIRNGDYILKTDFVKDENAKGGLAGLLDIVEQGEVIPISKNGKNIGYLEMDNNRKMLNILPRKYFTMFILEGERIKVDLKSNLPDYATKNKEVQALLKMLPRYVRVGKSILFPILPKIKELELLEKLIPATKLAKLASGSIVGMQVPEAFDIQEALNATKRVEGLINNKLAIDDNIQEITVQAIMSSAGRIKVMPIFGDKGSLSKLDYKQEEPDDLTGTVKELREVILDSIGIPYELIYKSDGSTKNETLKRYAKYLRRLKNIQRSLTEGIRDIISIHLHNKGIEFDDNKLKISFVNKLVEVDNLDKLEHMDVTVSLLGNLNTYVTGLMDEMSPIAQYINLDAYLKVLKDNLKTIGLAELILDKPKAKPPEPTGAPDDMGGEDDTDLTGDDTELEPEKDTGEPAPDDEIDT